MLFQRSRALRAVLTIVGILCLAALLAPTDLIKERGRTLQGLVGSYGANPSIHMYNPFHHSVFPPGTLVPLAAWVDMPGTPTSWVSATFYVDGVAIPATTSGSSMYATWSSVGATNPSEHNVYATATVTDIDGHSYSLSSLNAPPAGDGYAFLFAIADVYLRRAEFTDSHPVYYDDAGNFSVPSSAGGSDSRPHWELLNGPSGPYERGPYELCREMSSTAALTLNTNVGSTSPALRIEINGSLAAWPTWHTFVSISGSGAGSTTTPALSTVVDTQYMYLNNTTQLGFSDGYWVNLNSKYLYFTTWTDVGPHPAETTETTATNEYPGASSMNIELGEGGDDPEEIPGVAQGAARAGARFGGFVVAQAPVPAAPPKHLARFKRVAQAWAFLIPGPAANVATVLTRRIYGFNDAATIYNPANTLIIYNPGIPAVWASFARNAGGGIIGEDFNVAAFLAALPRPQAVCFDYSAASAALMKELGLLASVCYLPNGGAFRPLLLNQSVYAGAGAVTPEPIVFSYHQTTMFGGSVYEAAFAPAPAFPPNPNLTGIGLNAYCNACKCPHAGHWDLAGNFHRSHWRFGYPGDGTVLGVRRF